MTTIYTKSFTKVFIGGIVTGFLAFLLIDLAVFLIWARAFIQ